MSTTDDWKSTRRPSSSRLKSNSKTSIAAVSPCKRNDLHSNTINAFSERFANLRQTSKKKWKPVLSRWKTRKLKPWKKVTNPVSPSEKSNCGVVFVHALSSNFATDSSTVRHVFVQNTIVAVYDSRKTLLNSCSKNLRFNFVKRRTTWKNACVRMSNLQSLDVGMSFVLKSRSKSKQPIPSD